MIATQNLVCQAWSFDKQKESKEISPPSQFMANQGTSWELILNKEFEICVKLQLKLNDDDDEEEWINLSWKIMQFNWFLFPNLNVPSLIFRTVWLASPSSSQGCIMYLEKNRKSANELSVLGCVPEASHWDTWSWLLGSNSEKLLYGVYFFLLYWRVRMAVPKMR